MDRVFEVLDFLIVKVLGAVIWIGFAALLIALPVLTVLSYASRCHAAHSLIKYSLTK